jgi:hypothetical protein
MLVAEPLAQRRLHLLYLADRQGGHRAGVHP